MTFDFTSFCHYKHSNKITCFFTFKTTDFDVEPKSDIKNGANRMVASPEKTAISSTSLSNDLYSRLNFQPKTEDNSKVVMKRRLSSDEEMEVEKPARVHYNVVLNSKPATEIQSTVVQLNSNKKRVLSLDEQMKLGNNQPIKMT